MRRLLRGAKRAVLQAAAQSGAETALLASAWRQRRLAILGFHGVSQLDEHEWEPDLYHSPSVLEARLDALQRLEGSVLPLREGVARLHAGTLPPRAVVLTFDDGNRDFLDIIWPMLRRRGMPATLYVTTYYVEHRFRVFNTCVRYLLWRARNRSVALPEVLGDAREWDLRSASEREALFWALLHSLDARNASGAERDAVLAHVEQQLGAGVALPAGLGLFELLTPAQVERLVGEGVDVQLHTHRHRFPADDAALRLELRDNADSLARAGVRADGFAYPGGHYRPEALPILQDLGITTAVTCEPGLATARSHPLLLPRFVDSNAIPEREFVAMVSGVRDLLPTSPVHRRLPRLPVPA